MIRRVKDIVKLVPLDFDPVPLPAEQLWYLVRGDVFRMSLEFGHRGYVDAPFTTRIFRVDDKVLGTAPDLSLCLKYGQLNDRSGEMTGLRGTRRSNRMWGLPRRTLP